MIPQRDKKINELKYGLYVVSTPIGNLKDITLRAIEINAHFATAHNNLGDILRAQNKLDESLISFNRAIELNPDLIQAKMSIESIKTKVLCLEDDTIVFCGHGPSTTIGKERNTNPFLQ